VRSVPLAAIETEYVQVASLLLIKTGRTEGCQQHRLKLITIAYKEVQSLNSVLKVPRSTYTNNSSCWQYCSAA
jgi:hypothetical protein